MRNGFPSRNPSDFAQGHETPAISDAAQVPDIMSQKPWQITNTAACVYVGTAVWPTLGHTLGPLVQTSFQKFVSTLIFISHSAIELVTFFVGIIVTDLGLQGRGSAPLGMPHVCIGFYMTFREGRQRQKYRQSQNRCTRVGCQHKWTAPTNDWKTSALLFNITWSSKTLNNWKSVFDFKNFSAERFLKPQCVTLRFEIISLISGPLVPFVDFKMIIIDILQLCSPHYPSLPIPIIGGAHHLSLATFPSIHATRPRWDRQPALPKAQIELGGLVEWMATASHTAGWSRSYICTKCFPRSKRLARKPISFLFNGRSRPTYFV